MARTPPDRTSLLAEVTALPPQVQVAVLRECVKRMPLLDRSESFDAGSVLYDVASQLYVRRLPYEESDVCALLQTSKHTCGHGSDVTPPLDIAHAYMRTHGFSAPIAAATRLFLDALSGVGSSQAQFARRRAAIMLMADPTDVPGSESGWSAHFRFRLRELPDDERVEWQRFVLSMKANDVYVQPAVWRKSAARFLSARTPRNALQRIDQWISSDISTVRTGGSHVLKHFVWLLDEIAADEELRPACDALVVRLSRIDWSPKERAAKFMIAAAYYLSRRPPEVAWEALQEIERWNGETPGKIRDVSRAYAKQHGLALVELVEPVPPSPTLPPVSGRVEETSWIRRWISRLFRW